MEDELRSAVEARKELGPDYEEHLIESFLAKVDRRLVGRGEQEDDPRGISFVTAAVSLGVGIPITAIAISHGLAALIVCWAGIVLVNLIVAARR